MEFKSLYSSVFGILRVEGTNAKIAGTGFVINTNPIYILTCNHVVSEGNEKNNAPIRYSITKRSDSSEEFDLRQAQISYLSVKRIIYKPELDLAILELDPTTNNDVATKLGIQTSKALQLNFNNNRKHGDQVEWLTTAATGDLTLTPRFFKGNITAHYINNQAYGYKNAQGVDVQQIISGARVLEIDKLFIPGSSGSPILDTKSNQVIGFVHAFRSWPIITNTEITHPVQILQNQPNPPAVNLKYKLPLVTSLSLGIDVRTIEEFLREQKLLPMRKNWWDGIFRSKKVSS